jgi:hypothetical protein
VNFLPQLANGATITIERDGAYPLVVKFSELNEVSVNHDIRAKERFDGCVDHECRSTTITLKGRLAGGPPNHEHEWKCDSFGATSVDEDPPHFGLVCKCGATGCGNLEAGIVHNVREGV